MRSETVSTAEAGARGLRREPTLRLGVGMDRAIVRSAFFGHDSQTGTFSEVDRPAPALLSGVHRRKQNVLPDVAVCVCLRSQEAQAHPSGAVLLSPPPTQLADNPVFRSVP